MGSSVARWRTTGGVQVARGLEGRPVDLVIEGGRARIEGGRMSRLLWGSDDDVELRPDPLVVVWSGLLPPTRSVALLGVDKHDRDVRVVLPLWRRRGLLRALRREGSVATRTTWLRPGRP